MDIQSGMGISRRERKIPTATFGIETFGDSDGFQQSGFSGPVLTDKERNIRVQLKVVEVANGWN